MRQLLIIAVILTWVPMVCSQDPEITERILPVIKRIGETAMLDCVVIRQNDNKVYWIHKDTQTTISSDDIIELDEKHNEVIDGLPKFMVRKYSKEGKNTYVLIINRLESRDAGWYTCKIIHRGSDRNPSKDGQLIVVEPPAIIYSRTTQPMTIQEGLSVNLTCDATGHPDPNITWVRGNGGVLPNQKMRFKNKWLYIEKIKPAERGVYRCLADNNVRPPAQFDIMLTVNFKPVARAVQSSYGQAQNRMFDVTLECRIGGFPEPDLRWYQKNAQGNWEIITNDDKHILNILLNHANILSPYERWFQLVIRTVTANDYGIYVCAGNNDFGSSNATVEMFETSECQGPNCPEEQDPERSSAIVFTSPLLAIVGYIICFLVSRV